MHDSRIKNVIVVHAARRWATFHRRHMLLALAEALPETAALICVDRPVTPDVSLWKHPRRFWASSWVGLHEQADGDRLNVLTWRLVAHDITADKIPVLQRLNRRLARRMLRSYLEAHYSGAPHVVHWIYHPVQRWVYDAFPEAGKVYECYDEYARTPEGRWVAARWSREEPVLRRADLTFVTTERLMQTRRALLQRAALLPNGVPDFFFGSIDLHADAIDQIPHPRIGYVGNVRPPIDLGLLETVCRRRPDWNFVFVGPIVRSPIVGRLRRLGNVYFLGVRPYREIPGIIKRLDAGLIPFRINEFSVVMKPLKLGEYLAGGLPVVASRLPELQVMGDLVWCAPNQPGAFEAAVTRALNVDRSDYAARAMAAARDLSWSAIMKRDVLPELKQVFGI